jgi:hypothetical protein
LIDGDYSNSNSSSRYKPSISNSIIENNNLETANFSDFSPPKNKQNLIQNHNSSIYSNSSNQGEENEISFNITPEEDDIKKEIKKNSPSSKITKNDHIYHQIIKSNCLF